jgi:hypothetical protein
MVNDGGAFVRTATGQIALFSSHPSGMYAIPRAAC